MVRTEGGARAGQLVIGEWAGDGGADRTAERVELPTLVAIAGLVMSITWLMGSSLGIYPVAILMVFAFIDLASGFCAACWAYALWYKVRCA